MVPGWVLKYREKGTEVHVRGENYYLCRVSSKWDPVKKRAKKITGEYLGKITKDGLVPPKHKRVAEKYKHITVKEYGATHFIQSLSKDIISSLKKHYPFEWKELFVLAVFRLVEKTSLKNLSFYYNNSFLSETIKDAKTSHKFFGDFLRGVGSRRGEMASFMREFFINAEHAIIDLTNIFSYSQNLTSATLGKNKNNIYTPQVNLVLIYSTDKTQPIYFRLVSGSIRDVSTIIKTVYESRIQNIVFIGDKGIYSAANAKTLKKEKIDYVLPLKRNSRYINYDKLKTTNRKKLGGYFAYNKRNIWFYTTKTDDKKKVITYLDLNLKSEEENDLATRIKLLEEKKKESELDKEDEKNLKKYKANLYKKHYRNGTLSVTTSLKKTPEKIYELIKSRASIEQAFDTFKNTLQADKTYARDEQQLEAWIFINFIALQLYCKTYALLIEKEMLNQHSPTDIITHLKRVQKLKANNEWMLAEIPKKSRNIIEKLGIDIPITKNG